MNETTQKKKKKRFQGTVVSDKMDKTAVVRVDRYVKHPKYLKYIEKSQKLKAHNPDNSFKKGDTVVIEEVRPISKTKRFAIIEKVEK